MNNYPQYDINGNLFSSSFPLFIISQGRDGSTLLQRLLNQIPGFNICGENWDFMGSMMDVNYHLKSLLHDEDHKVQSISKDKYDEYENSDLDFKPAWYNNFNPSDVKCNITTFIKNMLNTTNHRVWGCKEIRWAVEYEYLVKDNIRYLDGFKLMSYEVFKRRLDYIKILFPNCKFIFTSRNIEDQLKSGWWAEHKYSKETLITLNNYNNSYLKHSDNSYHLTYNDIIECSDNFKNLYTFLNEEFVNDSYNKVINKKV